MSEYTVLKRKHEPANNFYCHVIDSESGAEEEKKSARSLCVANWSWNSKATNAIYFSDYC